MRFLVAIFATLILAGPGAAFAYHDKSSASVSGPTTQGVSLGIRSTAAALSSANPIEIIVEVRNKSGSDVLLTGLGMMSSYKFIVTNEATGKILPTVVPVSDVYSAGPVNIAPGESWFSQFDLRKFVKVINRGTYDVVAESSTLRIGSGMVILPVKSNHITLHITR